MERKEYSYMYMGLLKVITTSAPCFGARRTRTSRAILSNLPVILISGWRG